MRAAEPLISAKTARKSFRTHCVIISLKSNRTLPRPQQNRFRGRVAYRCNSSGSLALLAAIRRAYAGGVFGGK